MSAVRTADRGLTGGAFILVATIAVVVAPLAHADEKAYIDYLRDHGVTVHHDDNKERAEIARGNRICADLRQGRTLVEVRSTVPRWRSPETIVAGLPLLCPSVFATLQSAPE
ncbi:DUF732 domain-containing protein [Mycolicibacter kumamotonensis]|uniref:DUF732 domain-containing protein n=1 Tax=Mycolicibacter kumamotonensis TaxID=354243 RepID=UPI0009FFBF4F|nr:DUF732 domain-containing protein [Mycolicibacter kumamotonensis]